MDAWLWFRHILLTNTNTADNANELPGLWGSSVLLHIFPCWYWWICDIYTSVIFVQPHLLRFDLWWYIMNQGDAFGSMTVIQTRTADIDNTKTADSTKELLIWYADNAIKFPGLWGSTVLLHIFPCPLILLNMWRVYNYKHYSCIKITSIIRMYVYVHISTFCVKCFELNLFTNIMLQKCYVLLWFRTQPLPPPPPTYCLPFMVLWYCWICHIYTSVCVHKFYMYADNV